MNTIEVTIKDRVAILSLKRGRSNAINAEMVAELQKMIKSINQDENIGGLIITGNNGFFTAGLDLIELFSYDEAQIKDFWHQFLQLIYLLTSFKKPLVFAISGHSPAGGCVMALSGDYRLMADGKYIIGLNEVAVGIIVPNSIFSLFAFCIGEAKASRNLLEGKLLNIEEALSIGLIDEVADINSLMTAAEKKIRSYLQYDQTTWMQTKLNIRKELIAKVGADQSETLNMMLQQWWAPSTRSILNTIIKNLKSPKETKEIN